MKVTLYDSSKIREDLNWHKLSFRESFENVHKLSSSLRPNTNTNNNNKGEAVYGWKESSFALENGGDDIWRIHFVCDLNVQNIHNWLFTPLIDTRDANRVTLNLTFTIRECEQFPIKQVVKNCREKFELYYEEVDAASETNSTSEYFMGKIKQVNIQTKKKQLGNVTKMEIVNMLK